MKFKWDKKYLYWGVTATIVLAIAVLFNFLLQNNAAIRKGAASLARVSLPIISGFVMAFIINPLLKWFENSVFAIFDKKSMDRVNLPVWKQNLYRILSLVLSYLVVIILIASFAIAVFPQIRDSIISIYEMFPVYKANFLQWLEGLMLKYPEITKYIDNAFNSDESYISNWADDTLYPWLKTLASNASIYVFNLFKVLKDLVIGIIVSVYILLKKEEFKGQFKKICYSIFNVKISNIIIKNTRMANDKFSGFIVGKIVDSLIIGVLCFIGCTILKIEYPVLIALIIGVTNIIPFFGPVIGAIPCVILLLVINPIHSLYFLIFVIILQQLDGNIIGPKILGSSTGISGFWVIFAITVFGGFWGIPGMIIGVPLMAVIYSLVQSGLEISLKNKELKTKTDDYVYLDYIENETKEFVDKELPSVLIEKKRQAKKDQIAEKKRIHDEKKQARLDKKNSENKDKDKDKDKDA